MNRHFTGVVTAAFLGGVLLSWGLAHWVGASASQLPSGFPAFCLGSCEPGSGPLNQATPSGQSAGGGNKIVFTSPGDPSTASDIAAAGTAAADTGNPSAAAGTVQLRRKISAVAWSSPGAPAGTVITANVSCDPGGHELGGGGRVITDDAKNSERVALTQSYETSDTARAVVGVVTADLASTESADVIATILCAY